MRRLTSANATRLMPSCFVGHLWAAKAYEELAEFPNAIQELEECDELRGGARGNEYYDSLSLAYQKDGSTGYWTKLLGTALTDSPPDRRRLPVLFARLKRMDEAYQYLEKACASGAYEDGDIQFDSCWERSDPKFEKIANRYTPYRDLR